MTRYKIQDTKIYAKCFIILQLVTCILHLSSCGLHPVYGVNKYTNQGVEQHLAQIQIGSIPNREGQFLRNELIDRFYRTNRTVSPQYALDISNLSESTKELDITKDADSTRGQLKTTATMSLRNTQTGHILLERNLTSIASYNTLNSEFTNRVSEANTRANTLRDIARQIEQQIALYFKNQH